MFTKRLELFKLFGFSVKVDLSWLVIAVLVTWSLAVGLFPNFSEFYPFPAEDLAGLSPATYWTMGVIGMLGLFASIVLHEFGHSLMARQQGMPMKGITLFIFGGVAEMTDEPPTAKAEFLVAIAGPVVTVVISAVCFGLTLLGNAAAWPGYVNAVLWYLFIINAVVLAFNLLPAFPLDGGRVLRSILWQIKGSLRWATRITSSIGAAFGVLLIAYGVFLIILNPQANLISGLWAGLLGLFLRGAAQMSYQQLLMRRALEGEPVSRFMTTEPQTVPSNATVHDFVEDYVYRHHYKMFPIVENGTVKGCLTTRRIRDIPRSEWNRHTVEELIEACGIENTVSPDDDAMEALSKMRRNDVSRLMVTEGDQLRGVIAMKDLMRFMSTKIELEES